MTGVPVALSRDGASSRPSGDSLGSCRHLREVEASGVAPESRLLVGDSLLGVHWHRAEKKRGGSGGHELPDELGRVAFYSSADVREYVVEHRRRCGDRGGCRPGG